MHTKTFALALALLLGAWTFSSTQSARIEVQSPRRDPIPMTAGAVSLRITLGLKDTEPTAWDGDMKVSEGRVSRLSGQLRPNDRVEGSAWTMSTRFQGQGPNRQLQHVVLLATLDAPASAKLELQTKPGSFSVLPADLKLGSSASFLQGAATVERLPPSLQITHERTEDDFPACASGGDGTIWCAYVAYQNGNPVVDDEVRQGKFDSLITKNHGDAVRLLRFDGKAWHAPMDVTQGLLDVWRPSVSIDGKGIVWVAWSQNAGGNWDIHARSFDTKANTWSRIDRITNSAGADINVVSTTGKSGTVWLAWQGWENGDFAIRAEPLGGARKGVPRTQNFGSANEWNPSIAADSKGKIYVAFDTYRAGNYDTYLWILDERGGNRAGEIVAVAASPRFEARPSITVDPQDRVWIAYEDSDPNWGKDYGTRWEGKSGVPFYLDRNIVVGCYRDGKFQKTKAVMKTELITTTYPPSERHRISFPRLSADDKGRIWLVFRRIALKSGAGERWVSYASYIKGDLWSDPLLFPYSDNLLDNRPALVPQKGSGLLGVYSGDGRTAGTITAIKNNLFATQLSPEGEAMEPAFAGPQPAAAEAPPSPVHPDETEDIRRVRAYRANVGGKNYQLLRGEFHRHTEISSHRDQDGPMEEVWRYGLDVARMDWIGPGDHDYGVGREYTWWLTQKQVEIYHHAPIFMPMFTHERSVVYPSGHRNVMIARRGIRALPRMATAQQPEILFGTPEGGAPDIKNLYAYLKHFDAICSSHTSATGMGTDWRDNDPAVEPVVEIYQGHRQNYEEPNAPKSAKNAEDSIGGYQPAGYVWNAFAKGYKLGFQISSDHVSTHISYGIVFAEQPTRESIVDAFKKRHSYGAHDNIILDVRCGENMMGDEFVLTSQPKIDISVMGTAPVARIDIVRQIEAAMPGYVYATEPKQKNVKLSWTDTAAKAGALNMYYVRIMQEDGKMAWASPMWIRYEPAANR